MSGKLEEGDKNEDRRAEYLGLLILKRMRHRGKNGIIRKNVFMHRHSLMGFKQ